MIFSSPSFLWALGLLGIPIIIHLFQFRRYRQIKFSDISLLKQVQTQSHTQNQLKHLLILLMRVLTLALVVLAFAEPIIPASMSSDIDDSPVITILIDNTLSMQNEVENSNLLKQAQQDAYQIIESYGNETKFQLLTHDLAPESRRVFDAQGIIKAIDQVEFTTKTLTPSELWKHHQSQKIEHDYTKSILYYLSDFNFPTDSLETVADSNTAIRLVQYRGDFNKNISIDSAWVSEPLIQVGVPFKLNLTISNHGQTLVQDQIIEISTPNQMLGSINLNLEANSSIDTHLILTFPEPRPYLVTISTDDVPISFDNEYYVAIKPKKDIRVAEIRGTSTKVKAFEKLFDDEGVAYQFFNEKSIIQDSLSETNLLILNDIEDWSSGLLSIIQNTLNEGYNVLITLPEGITKTSQELISEEFKVDFKGWRNDTIDANELTTQDIVFDEVFESVPKDLNFPRVHGYHSVGGNQLEGLINLYNGDVLVSVIPSANGRLYIIPTSLDDANTNFRNHALFVPTVFNMALRSGVEQPLSYSTSTKVVSVNKIESEAPRLRHLTTDRTYNVGKAFRGISLSGLELLQGFYELGDADRESINLAFNLDRNESQLTNLSDQEIITMLQSASNDVQLYAAIEIETSSNLAMADMNTELWYWFILSVFILLMGETILIKLLKS